MCKEGLFVKRAMSDLNRVVAEHDLPFSLKFLELHAKYHCLTFGGYTNRYCSAHPNRS